MTIEAIQNRMSCRTFSTVPLEPDKIRVLEDFLKLNTTGPFGNRLRFELISFGIMSREAIRACGTYGVIRGASFFFVGAVEKKTGALEDFGYGMELNILQAQSLGLGTCWLGGTFKRTGFAKSIDLLEGELLPAVSPVGYAADKRSVLDRVFRFSAGSDRRRPWEDLFFESHFQAMQKKDAGLYKLPLECVRLGPSAANKQPWRIVREASRFHFYLERTLGYTSLYGKIQLQDVDMGIAMCHFELASREVGLNGRWLFENPGLKASKWEYVATWQAY